jgi:Reverse transcriptase (RNA-dependent DNA polymerase)
MGFPRKRDGTVWACLVALGYLQVSGVDSSDNFVPVVSNTAFRTIPLMIQNLKLSTCSIDIETSFWNRDLSKEIYIKVPTGLNEEKVKGTTDGTALKLIESIYGSV